MYASSSVIQFSWILKLHFSIKTEFHAAAGISSIVSNMGRTVLTVLYEIIFCSGLAILKP